MGDADSSAAIKESRRVLRRVQRHLSQSLIDMGANRENIGLVDVVYHPKNKLPHINYVSPRKNTAWIPGPEIKKGLDRLRELERKPRVIYIEGLYPPLFAKSIRDLGLVIEQETTIMVYTLDEKRIKEMKDFKLPPEMQTEEVSNEDGSALWWYIWRNVNYDVLTKGVEPLYVGRSVSEIAAGHQVDILLYMFGFPIAVARLTIYDDTAHIAALAIITESHTPEIEILLHKAALKAAADRGCTLVFVSGEGEDARSRNRQVGFVDCGSTVRYVEDADEPDEEADGKSTDKSVFVLR